MVVEMARLNKDDKLMAARSSTSGITSVPAYTGANPNPTEAMKLQVLSSGLQAAGAGAHAVTGKLAQR